MFYSQVILAKKGPLAKVWLAAHWGDKKLARPQIFATDISQSCVDIMNPSVPLALRLSGHLLLGVVRIYSRKVKYVLNDCTEAMLKLQMAFTSKPQLLDKNGNPKEGSGRELLQEMDTSHMHMQLVPNFGEFDRVHVVEGFCLPLPEDNEWILADEHEHEHETEQHESDPTKANQGLLLAAHLPKSHKNRFSSNPSDPQEEEEETWAPFDPDNEDDDDEDEVDADNLHNNSRVSDIEIVRAANESLLSEDQTRRSSILDKSALTTDSAIQQTPNNHPSEQDFDFNVPFGDDESEDENRAPRDPSFGASTLGDSALDLSREHPSGTPMSANANATANANANSTGLGLDMDDDDDLLATKKRESTSKPRKRRRKRRKVVIDNHHTELTNDHIRAMLQNTDDIVRPMVHPASVWDESDANKNYSFLVLEDRQKQASEAKQKRNAPKQELPSLTQPFLQDDNALLHPKLKLLWKDNYWKALGESCPYPKHQTADEVEAIRRDRNDDESTSSSKGEASDLEIPPGDKMDHGAQPTEDMEFPTVQDDDDDEEEEMDLPLPDFGDDPEDTAALQRKSTGGENDGDLLDLGMVNDMVLDSDQDDEHEEDRQALGDVSSSTTKWHKHTVRVYKHLQKCIQDPNRDDPTNKPESVNFDELTKHVVSRRNASSIFFEMLQLKTWDFIEVDQDEAYGKIAISAGLRFGEDAPNN